MSTVFVDDEFLYTHMPQAEALMLSHIPPEGELEHHFSRRFNRKMRALIKYEHRTPRMRKTVYRVKVAVAVFAVVFSLAFGAMMSVDAARTKIFEVMTKIFEELTSVRVSGNGGLGGHELEPIIPAYVPKGYNQTEQTNSETDCTIVYSDNGKRNIIYTQELLTASERIFDTEDADVRTVQIDSQEVHLIIKESRDTCQLYWYDDQYLFWISGNHIESDNLLKMAESIIKR